MTSLQNITGQYLELNEMATDPDSDISHDMIADTLEGIVGSFEDKAKGISSVINNMGSDIASIKDEIDRLAKRKKVIENRESSIKEYLRINMEALEIKKISCPLFTITLAAGRDVVQIDNEDELPDEFVKIKTSSSPDKTLLLKALKEGPIEGASLVKSKTSIRIK